MSRWSHAHPDYPGGEAGWASDMLEVADLIRKEFKEDGNHVRLGGVEMRYCQRCTAFHPVDRDCPLRDDPGVTEGIWRSRMSRSIEASERERLIDADDADYLRRRFVTPDYGDPERDDVTLDHDREARGERFTADWS